MQLRMLYGKEGLELTLPEGTDVLAGQDPPALPDVSAAVKAALAHPLGTPPLAELVRNRRPRRVAITISDITRPVPNREILPELLEALGAAGVEDAAIVIVIGTGMHRPSTPGEREALLGRELLARLAVVDHRADAPEALVALSADPPVRVSRAFAEADLRIVTGLIEPHFMAGFSGGRKGVCPALTDLETIQRFHCYETLADPRAKSGLLEGNPCHAIALEVARKVGVDFLVNVALTRDRRTAGVYCGELEQAHLAGCADVARWTVARPQRRYDLVVTCGGGYPLDQTFYQTVKGQVEALPALAPTTTLLQVSHCGEGLGSAAYTELLLRFGHDWEKFLAHAAARPHVAELDQWELQMQCRVLERIGRGRLWLVTDGIPPDLQQRIAITPILGAGDTRARAQRALDRFLEARPDAAVAAIPDGPYTMLAAG